MKKSNVRGRSFLVVIHYFGDPESFKVCFGKPGTIFFKDWR